MHPEEYQCEKTGCKNAGVSQYANSTPQVLKSTKTEKSHEIKANAEFVKAESKLHKVFSGHSSHDTRKQMFPVNMERKERQLSYLQLINIGRMNPQGLCYLQVQTCSILICFVII